MIDIYLDDFTPTSVLRGRVVFADLPEAAAHLEVWRQTARIAELVVRRDVAVQGTPQPFVIDCGQPISPLDLLTRRIDVRLLQSGSPITLRLSEALVRRLAETQFVVPLFEESFSPDPLSRLHRTVREFKREDILSLPETPLCKLMKASGSDKAGDWHNYAPL